MFILVGILWQGKEFAAGKEGYCGLSLPFEQDFARRIKEQMGLSGTEDKISKAKKVWKSIV